MTRYRGDPARLPVHLAGASGRCICAAAVAIWSPAGGSGRWIWPVDLAGGSARLLSPAGAGRRIDGSLVQLVVDRWVSGHKIDGKDPNCAGLRSRAGRFEQRGGVLGSHVSLKEKARTKAGHVVGARVLGVMLRPHLLRAVPLDHIKR